jgi:hypothetical protein
VLFIEARVPQHPPPPTIGEEIVCDPAPASEPIGDPQPLSPAAHHHFENQMQTPERKKGLAREDSSPIKEPKSKIARVLPHRKFHVGTMVKVKGETPDGRARNAPLGKIVGMAGESSWTVELVASKEIAEVPEKDLAIPKKSFDSDQASAAASNHVDEEECGVRWRRVGYVDQHAAWYAYGLDTVKCIPWSRDLASQVGPHLLHEQVIVDQLPHAGAHTAGNVLQCAIDTVSAALKDEALPVFKIGMTANPFTRFTYDEAEGWTLTGARGQWNRLTLVATKTETKPNTKTKNKTKTETQTNSHI